MIGAVVLQIPYYFIFRMKFFTGNIRFDADGKKYLYDIIDIKRET